MFYGPKSLIGIFLVFLTFILTASAQNLEEKFHHNEQSVISEENSLIEPIREDNWKIKTEFNDSEINFFKKPKSAQESEKLSFPIDAKLPQGAPDKPKFSGEKSGQEESEPTNYRFKRGEKEINFEFGISPFHPTKFGPQEYDLDDRKFGLATFRWGRVFGTVKTVTYEYLFEVSPIVYAYRNELTNPDYISPTQTPNETPTIRGNTYGFAVSPLTFRTYFFSKNRFKPFGQFGVGMLFTNKPLPTPDSTYYNFTGYFGGGALYHVTRKQGISVGYRYYHLSNFNTSDPNYGVNANTFSIGYSFFYGK